MAFGALYFALNCPNDFANVQDTLLGLTASITLTVHHKLAGHTRVLSGMVSEVRRQRGARGAGRLAAPTLSHGAQHTHAAWSGVSHAPVTTDLTPP